MNDYPLEVRGLCKKYPQFELCDVDLTVDKGEICGFIGRNGAGKTTTLKSILNLVHPSSGSIRCFGMDIASHEDEIKQRIGFSCGETDWYKRKKIRSITSVTKTFFNTWDEDAYREYIKLFEIDEDKCPMQLSQGMRVKLNLALALSHRAELLILDEPTSGLDPFSRAELLDVFGELSKRGIAVLFSTHIITDIEKCADSIAYIRRGRIAARGSREEIEARFGKTAGETFEDLMIRIEKEGYDE